MFERHKGGERAILVQLNMPDMPIESKLAEFAELATSANAEILSIITGARSIPEVKYYVGLGKAEEIRQQVELLGAELVLFNHELSPSQERNLERLLKCRVVDRSGLILDIFAQRARTFEGRLQVELAQLEHMSTRLIRGWTHLERQKGGIGLRGPGETQLETDRRLLNERIKYIHQRLEKVRGNRAQNRQARRKSGMLTVSLVGYTNAGKSSLFNALTHSDIYTANQLFATLDPTMRKLNLPGSKDVILADTVGFIRDLPHHLIKAFHATLEETKEADLLLHVIDLSNPSWRETIEEVNKVLTTIGLPKNIKIIQVFNKIDLKQIKAKMSYNCAKVWVSAQTSEGLDYLQEAISTKLFGDFIEKDITLEPSQGKLRAQLFALGAVISETELENGGWDMKIRINEDLQEDLMNDSNKL